MAAIGFSIAIPAWLRDSSGGTHSTCSESESLSASPGSSLTFKYYGVATDASRCSCIGRDILNKTGSTAVDAAIASLLCVGIVNMHSTGIGGGGVMVHYKNSTKRVTVIDFRETAPMVFSSALENVTPENRNQTLLQGTRIYTVVHGSIIMVGGCGRFETTRFGKCLVTVAV